MARTLFIAGSGELTARPSFDTWSVGCLLYEMFCNVSLLPRSNADKLYTPEAQVELCSWKEVDQAKLTMVFPKATLSQREFACDLIKSSLRGDPWRWPKTMMEAIQHPFFGLQAHGLGLVGGSGAKMRACLGYSLSALTCHARIFARAFTLHFCSRVNKLCMLPPKGGRMLIVAELSNRKPKWQDINGNGARIQEASCSVCGAKFGGVPLVGEVVDLWVGTKVKGKYPWNDISKVLSSCGLEHFLVEILLGGDPKCVKRDLSQIRRRQICLPSAGEASQVSSK